MNRREFFSKYIWLFLAVIIVTALILQTVGFHQYAVQMYNYQDFKRLEDIKDSDMVVVLAGGMGRIQGGYELMKSTEIPMMFISGADSMVSFDDIARSHSWDGSVSERVKVDNISTRTLYNAKTTRDYALENEMKKIVLVTSIYHLQRSLFLFSKVFAMDDIEIVPYGTVVTPLEFNSWWDDYNVFRKIFLEYLKYQYYKLTMSGRRV